MEKIAWQRVKGLSTAIIELMERRALLEQKADDEQRLGEKAEQQKLVAGNEEVFQRAASFKQSTSYDDTPNLRIRQELALYKSIDTQEKRDDIAQLLGVDIYA